MDKNIDEIFMKEAINLARKAEIISLSTTLATNACVEDKGGRAKLIFFGGDRQVIDKLGRQCGLPSSNEIYIQESYTSFSGEAEREPDWELFRSQTESGFEELDGVGIIEINAMRNGAVVEKKAREVFRSIHLLFEVGRVNDCLQLCLLRKAGQSQPSPRLTSPK